MDRLGEWPRWYRLDDAKLVRRCRTWQDVIDAHDGNRVVCITRVGTGSVSTVFLCLDHNPLPDPDARPMVFETAQFSEDDSQGGLKVTVLERYSTYPEALAGHSRYVQMAERHLRQANAAVKRLLAGTSGGTPEM